MASRKKIRQQRKFKELEARFQLNPNLNLLAKILRLQKGMSQQELARRAGISQSSISDIENGHARIDRALALALADAFELSEDEKSYFLIAGKFLPQGRIATLFLRALEERYPQRSYFLKIALERCLKPLTL